MKKVFFVAALFTSAGFLAQNGVLIEFKITSSQGPTGLCALKVSDMGSKSEFKMVIPQMPGGGINSVNLTKKENPDVIYTINDQSKTYSETKKSDFEAEDKSEYTVKKIGEEKVNGYNCVHALVTESGQTSDMWTTKDLAEYNKYSSAFATNKKMGSQKRDKALKDAGCDGMPVKIINKGNKREGEVTMELVKFEKKNYAKADFEVPVGYTKSGSAATAPGGMQMKTQQEIMNMTPEERAKYVEDMKKQYGK